jgi:hypothetical protein
MTNSMKQAREGMEERPMPHGYKLQLAALVAPFHRIDEAPLWGKLLGAVGGLGAFLITDLFTSALFLIVASGAYDYFLGTRIARLRGTYDSLMAHAGALSKVSGVALMMLVRMSEHWMLTAGLVNTRGWIAAALTLSLFAVDLESIQQKREELGARPVPGLSTLTHWLHQVISRVLPETPQFPHDRRDPDVPDRRNP